MASELPRHCCTCRFWRIDLGVDDPWGDGCPGEMSCLKKVYKPIGPGWDEDGDHEPRVRAALVKSFECEQWEAVDGE